MLARKKTSRQGKNLPQDWSESLARLLNETYKSECKKNVRYFDVYGQIYADELLIIVSYLSEKDEAASPITLFLSCDPYQLANEEKLSETQSAYIELTGLFFDEIFSAEEWSEFEPDWQEVTHKKHNYYYKITRENINLTLEANKLLGDDFEDVEFDQDTEH
jgi:hypothetical protein